MLLNGNETFRKRAEKSGSFSTETEGNREGEWGQALGSRGQMPQDQVWKWSSDLQREKLGWSPQSSPIRSVYFPHK